MATTRVQNHLILSCKFSQKIDGLVSCTTSTTRDPFGPGELKIFRLSENDQLEQVKSLAWTDALLDTCWSAAQEDVAVTGSADNTLQLWRVFNDGSSPEVSFTGHSGPVTSVEFTPSGKILSGSLDGSHKIWDVERHKAVSTDKYDYEVLQATASNLLPHTILILLANNQFSIVDDRSLKTSSSISLNEQALCCDWSPHRPMNVLWSSQTGIIGCMDVRFPWNHDRSNVQCHQGPVRRARWLPGFCDIVVSVGFDGTTAITNMSTGKVLERVRHHSNCVYDVDVSPFHPTLLADCSWDSLLHIFEPRSLQNIRVYSHLINKL